MEASSEILVALIVVIGLTAIGLTVWLLRYLSKPKQREKTASARATSAPAVEEKVAAPAPDAVADLSQSPAITPSAVDSASTPAVPTSAVNGPADAFLLMRVWQDRDGFIMVEMEGQRYRRLFDIRDGALGRRVLEIINGLVAFSKGQESRLALPAPAQPTDVLESREESRRTSASPTPVPGAGSDTPMAEQAYTFLDALQKPQESRPKKPRITADPVPFRRRNVAREANITLDLASEIDQILQMRVQAEPKFGQRGLRVASAVDGGLRFEVDGGRYSALDEVPDPEVQTLIRTAISDWESRR